MPERKQLEDTLAPFEQQHTLRWWDDLSLAEQERLAQQIEQLDLETLEREMKRGPLVPAPEFLAKFQPPPYVRPSGSAEDAKAKAIGEELLRQGEVALVLVAGGEGTRLGYDGPKGTLPIGPVTGKTIFELHAEKIRAMRFRYGCALPLYVMTSDVTDDATRRFFDEHGNLGLGSDGVAFFRQGSTPVVNRMGKLLMSSKSTIATSPDGHGGCIAALKDSGMLGDMRSRGVSVVFYFQVDNVLAQIADPVFLGYHRQRQADMSLKVLQKRDPREDVGVVGCVEGRLHIVEYRDLTVEQEYETDDLGQLKYRMGSIAMHAFTLDFLERMSDLPDGLPIHQGHKDVPYVDDDGTLQCTGQRNGITFETFVFDVLPHAKNALVFETIREQDFSPVKNPHGMDSPETAKRALVNLYSSWLERSHGMLPRDERGNVSVSVEISPLFALDAEDLRSRLGDGLWLDSTPLGEKEVHLELGRRARDRTREPIQLDFSNMMDSAIGEAHGITRAELDGFAKRAADAVLSVQQRRAQGQQKPFIEREIGDLAWMDLPHERFQLERIKNIADYIRGAFDNFVVLGIGGSALGNTALISSLCPPYYNELDRATRGGPRIYVLDNVDPVQSHRLFTMLDPKMTAFNVITKGGSTAETMSQLLIVRERLRAAVGDDYNRHLIGTTSRDEGTLLTMAEEGRWEEMLIVPTGVGGRFSVLSPVGLLTAAVAGIDVDALLAGAAAMDERCRSHDLWQNPALMNAVLQYISDQRDKPMSVMMPYSYGLYAIADWYRQLWAESLGKRTNRKGEVVNCGPTPIKSLGATDQHSQVQLYMEGPYDKVITFLAVESFDRVGQIPRRVEALDGVDYLAGHTLKELLDAERIGTELALAQNGRPNCTITLPCISSHTIGQLLYLLEVQTAYSGEFYGINAFDQPGVELGKLNACAMLGRRGPKFAARKAEIDELLSKKERHVI